MMHTIKTDNSSIHFNEECYKVLENYINENDPSKIVILVDSNTEVHCLKKLLEHLLVDYQIDIVEIEAGEVYKTIETCIQVWNQFTEIGLDRKGLVINLGGGVITDLGGFAASTYKRGVNYINIPTSLLAMVDASVGGKTGVDLGHLKNLIGVINSGKHVLIDTSYLKTLPKKELLSGYSEMLKHGLIYDRNYWNELRTLKDFDQLDALIHKSVEIKHKIVQDDPFEFGMRKTLNFGHTLGHAIESYFLEQDGRDRLLHGEAIAIGMILESFISHKTIGLSEADLNEIFLTFTHYFDTVEMFNEDIDAIIDLLKYDKKNSHGNINFVLLERIGKPRIDCQVENHLIKAAFEYYLESS